MEQEIKTVKTTRGELRYYRDWDNYECMFSWDGDEDAINIIRRFWGDEIAESLCRL